MNQELTDSEREELERAGMKMGMEMPEASDDEDILRETARVTVGLERWDIVLTEAAQDDAIEIISLGVARSGMAT